MEVKKEENLGKYTTFRMGGLARNVYFPECVDDLISIEEEGKLHHIIGGGSNILINDREEFDSVVSLEKLDSSFEKLQMPGQFYIGASVRLQSVIRRINKEGCGGIEYLYSVPGLIGGAIYMNAGRGKTYNKTISDYIVEVSYFQNGAVHKIAKQDCGFAHRNSAFQNMDGCVILGAVFEFEPVSEEEANRRVKERIQLCREKQDNSKPNFGTVFCESDGKIMRMFSRYELLGKKNQIWYSPKTPNWLLHGEDGSFKDAVVLIERVKKAHRLFHKNCKAEVKIWYD